jgi:hypothetical protein
MENEMDVQEFLKTNANVVPSDLETDKGTDSQHYVSKIDGSYIGLVGFSEEDNERHFKFMIDHGISQLQNGTGHTVANMGFSEKEQKWYGWSHRAIFGFKIGSEVKRGDCAYMPVDEEDFVATMVRFWADKHHLDIEYRIGANVLGERGVFIDWVYSETVPYENLRGTNGGSFQIFPENFGKGEWKAESLEDAKQMAADFAESVS